MTDRFLSIAGALMLCICLPVAAVADPDGSHPRWPAPAAVSATSRPALADTADGIDPRLEQSIVRLDQNARYLKDIYLDLRKIAEHVMWRSDQLLNAVQKCALYVQQAETICRYEVELLSLLPYVRADRRTDFFTLRQTTLARAAKDTNGLISFIKIYQAFIEERTAADTISEALRAIEATIDLYGHTAEAIGSRE
jgi:hypothetical protein